MRVAGIQLIFRRKMLYSARIGRRDGKMIYKSSAEWAAAESKRVLLLGMSGVGKTFVSDILRRSGDWYHYSIDYRIGTRYMGEEIVDNFKREAMKNAFLARLLKSDSIYIASNISFNNLEPLSTYVGKPGNPELGGIPIKEYKRRQGLHFDAEVAALKDTAHFIDRSRQIYGYRNFVCDSGGSICEVVDPNDPEDEILTLLSSRLLLVWINGGREIEDRLLRRFMAQPKPMYYLPDFLSEHWKTFCADRGVRDSEVEPDDFARWIYARAMKAREPKYRAIARNWGIEVAAADIASVDSADAFCGIVENAFDAGRGGA